MRVWVSVCVLTAHPACLNLYICFQAFALIWKITTTGFIKEWLYPSNPKLATFWKALVVPQHRKGLSVSVDTNLQGVPSIFPVRLIWTSNTSLFSETPPRRAAVCLYFMKTASLGEQWELMKLQNTDYITISVSYKTNY